MTPGSGFSNHGRFDIWHDHIQWEPTVEKMASIQYVKPRGHTEFTTYPPIFNLTPKEGTVSSHAPSEAQHVLWELGWGQGPELLDGASLGLFSPRCAASALALQWGPKDTPMLRQGTMRCRQVGQERRLTVCGGANNLPGQIRLFSVAQSRSHTTMQRNTALLKRAHLHFRESPWPAEWPIRQLVFKDIHFLHCLENS